MRHRLPCLVRVACPSALSPPPSRAASSAAASTSTCALPGPARVRLDRGHAEPGAAPGPAGSSREVDRRRADNFLRVDTGPAGASALVERLRQRAQGLQDRAAGPAELRGERVEGPLAGTSEAVATGTGERGRANTPGEQRLPHKGKARRRPATVASQLDYAPLARGKSSPFSSADSLLARPLPESEPELYAFLRDARTTHPNVPPPWLAWFHAHPHIAPYASTRTYRLLLHRATATTDKRLVRALLSEMQERGFRLDDETRRILLRGYVRGGEDEQALAVLRTLGRAAAGVVLRSTKPRDLGEGAKRHGERQVLWKGWAARERDKRAEEERRAALTPVGDTSVPRGTYKRRRERPPAESAASAFPPSGPATRPPTLVPAEPAKLAGSDISTIVECLVQERRLDVAFALAETWLCANRPAVDAGALFEPRGPPMPPDPPAHKPNDKTAARYNSTALVLMNILLKALVYERPAPSAIRTFIDTFLAKHSAAPPARPLAPNIVTLRQLVSGCLGSVDAWDRATSLVDWFGYRFGLPPTNGSLTGRRRFFIPPSYVEGARVGAVEPSRAAASRAEAGRDPTLVPPHAVVPPDVAVLLFRHAVDQHARGTLGHLARVTAVRRWWRGFDRRGSDVWTYWKTRELEKRAMAVGLLPSKAARRDRRAG